MKLSVHLDTSIEEDKGLLKLLNQHLNISSANLEGEKSAKHTDNNCDSDDSVNNDNSLEGSPHENIDFKGVQLALRNYAKKHGREAAKEIMKKHGVESINAIDKSSYTQMQKIMKEII